MRASGGRARSVLVLALVLALAAALGLVLSGGARHEGREATPEMEIEDLDAATPEQIEEAKKQLADLKAATGNASQQFTGSFTQTGCGSNVFSVDAASTINV